MTTEFHRIKRLPPYVFAEVNAMKAKARAAGADIVDLGMGNPDLPAPRHVIEKLVETAVQGFSSELLEAKMHRIQKELPEWVSGHPERQAQAMPMVRKVQSLLKEKKWQAVDTTTPDTPAKQDSVNHPAHYKVGGIETIDFIEAKQLSYHLGNVIKYITRADHKGNMYEDLCKARWYLNREIANLQGKQE